MSAPTKREIFLTIVVKHPKVYEHIKNNVLIVGASRDEVEVKAYVVLEDPNHPLAKGDWKYRQALVESGLVSPQEAGMSFPVQIEAGWPDRSEQ